MRPNYLTSAFLLLSALFIHAQIKEQTSFEGRIIGIVVNEEGEPVEHARVCTKFYEHPGASTTGCHGYSDKGGRFEIDHWPMGTVSLFAIKPEEGYTDVEKSLTGKIRLTPEVSLAEVTVKLAAKSGILAGYVRDKDTGKAVKELKVTYIAVDGYGGACTSEVNIGSSGSFEFPVRSAIEGIVVLSAPGYKTWVYTDASNDSRALLRLQSGERRSLDIELEPDPANVSADVSPSMEY